MSDKKIGKLGYNPDQDRYGILVMDLWEDSGLHCGEMLEVWVDEEWQQDRIEFSHEWYLVFSNLSGSELEGLRVRF